MEGITYNALCPNPRAVVIYIDMFENVQDVDVLENLPIFKIHLLQMEQWWVLSALGALKPRKQPRVNSKIISTNPALATPLSG